MAKGKTVSPVITRLPVRGSLGVGASSEVQMAIADVSASLSLIHLSCTSLVVDINHNGSTRGADCFSCKLFIETLMSIIIRFRGYR
jgi:hypothetical protein